MSATTKAKTRVMSLSGHRKPLHALGIYSTVVMFFFGLISFGSIINPTAVVQAQTTNGPEIELENLDSVPFANRLVTSRIQNPEDGTRTKQVIDPVTGEITYVCCVPANKVHDVAKLRVHNRGNQPLQLSGSISGPWEIAGASVLPQTTIAPGASNDVAVKFVATSSGGTDGLYQGAFTLSTNDADEATVQVELAGFLQLFSERQQEPTLAQIIRVYGYGTDILGTGELDNGGVVEAVGEEVISPFWRRADSSQPVAVHQLAAYHGQGSEATISWYPKGASVTRIVTHDGRYGQSLLPAEANKPTLAARQFTPTSEVFGFRVDNEYSEPRRNTPAMDNNPICAQNLARCGHHMRWWPARDRQGNLMPGAWIMTIDYRSINYDYQDNVYFITNLKPEHPTAAAIAGPLPGMPRLVLDFDRAYPGSLSDKDAQTIGFRAPQRNKLDRVVGSSSFNNALLDIDTSGQGTLKITTTAGSNRNSDNSLVNGLLLPFDARIHAFVASARLLGPLTNLDSGFRQGGIMFGPGQDDFIKLVALSSANGPVIEFVMEQGAGTPVPGVTLPLPDAANLLSLDLRLYGNPRAGTVRAAYQGVYQNGQTTGEVFLPSLLTLTGTARDQFFSPSVQAGLLTTHKGTDTPITLTFDRFAIESTTSATGQPLFRIDTGTSPGRPALTGWRSDSTPSKLFTPTDAPEEPESFKNSEIANTTDDALYRTYRGKVDNTPPTLTYNIPIAQPRQVDLRLYFAELYWGAPGGGGTGPGSRIFDISAESSVLVDNFDVSAASGGPLTAVVVTLKGITVNDGNLTLAFKADVNLPAIAAIEVLEATPDNQSPVANAGVDQTAALSSQVTLDGNGSADPDGDALSYSWSQVEGAPVALTASGSQVTFTSPAAASELVFLLTVSDARGASATDTVRVTVSSTPGSENRPPVANAGADQTALLGSQVTLDGSSSSDPDGDVLSYDWSQVQGSPVTLTLNGAQASFTAPTETGPLVFLLTVTDTRGSTATDAVLIAVTNTTPVPGNTTPIANAGADVAVGVGAQVVLDGSGSSDPDADALSYAWTQVQGPAVTLTASGPQASFTAPASAAQFVFLLTVTDARGATAVDAVQVTVQQAPGGAPTKLFLPMARSAG